MLNNKPCGSCDHCDEVLRGTKGTNWAWCAKLSKYPYKEGPGQVFPEGVARVGSEEDLAVPKIVRKTDVEKNCAHFIPKKTKQNKQDLLKKLQTKDGKTVLR